LHGNFPQFAIIARIDVSRRRNLFRDIFIFFSFRQAEAMKIRISLVHYLNSAPLGWAFLHGPFRSEFEVVPASPARCADQLSSGEVDIGLIPSIEYQRIPQLQIIPDISISSLREVRSILLIKSRETQSIGSVALDSSSRTSVALTKVLLQAKMRIHPEYVSHPPDLPAMLKRCDAALLIGDPALRVQPENFDTIDLAGEWFQWQKKPFVCAFWACRADAKLPSGLPSIFREAKKWGLERREEIADAFGKSLNLPKSFLEHYLTNNIDYNLAPEHVEGLRRFYELAKQEELIPELRPLKFLSPEKMIFEDRAGAL
jgi:chorismate dehydratase